CVVTASLGCWIYTVALHDALPIFSGLETSLDAIASENPWPGTVVLHRLNRTEYATAVQDILGVKVEKKDLLPRDDEGNGFDNAADRKSTRLNSSHVKISYAVFCLK